ncbi:acyl carrier protein [Anaeromicropila populeti]|uniref:Acyl carrier protein n=1 Tax=Anaeromicropila populeti TaxID=37658 RepID=A0A1I6J0I8_9FIRM|nr:acyl carrier protein [Anaeromicropila populeti]SFR72448.1 Acyl carrier protein [Anaeromicropila populeti]
MTNLEKYQEVLKKHLGATEEELNDEKMVYNRYPKWDSVRHMSIVAELEEKFDISFETLDITSFNQYSAGIEILEKLGVSMQ